MSVQRALRLEEMTRAQLDELRDRDPDEWARMHELSPDYLAAARFLSLKELGLAPSRSEMTAREIEVLLFVAAERQRLTQERRDRGDVAGGDEGFQGAADAEEQDVGDGRLLSLMTRKRGR